MHDSILRLQDMHRRVQSSQRIPRTFSFQYHVFQSHEAEQPMEMVIRQDIYEDLQP